MINSKCKSASTDATFWVVDNDLLQQSTTIWVSTDQDVALWAASFRDISTDRNRQDYVVSEAVPPYNKIIAKSIFPDLF